MVECRVQRLLFFQGKEPVEIVNEDQPIVPFHYPGDCHYISLIFNK
jgi:hypothetical protein